MQRCPQFRSAYGQLVYRSAPDAAHAFGSQASRAEELNQLMETQVPMLLSMLTTLLDAAYASAHGEAARRAIDQRLPTDLTMPATPRSSPTAAAVVSGFALKHAALAGGVALFTTL